MPYAKSIIIAAETESYGECFGKEKKTYNPNHPVYVESCCRNMGADVKLK